MFANEAKRGTQAVHQNGTPGILADNKRGLIRAFEPSSGPDAGWARDEYIFKLLLVKPDGTTEPFELTPEQARQAEFIKDQLQFLGGF